MNQPNTENEKPFGTHKKVDEGWKSQVERDKSKENKEPAKSQPEPTHPPQAGDFMTFMSGLAMQAMMSLGEAPDPNTGKTRENPAEAKYLIDIIGMLQEKTKGNLTQQEAKAVEEALYGLKMAYVRKTSQPQQEDAGQQE